jgi:hypothetical protein
MIETDKVRVEVRAEDGGGCSYCFEYYKQMGMAINWTERVGTREETNTRLICVKCLIRAFDKALGKL